MGSDKRILVVDDEEHVLFVLEKGLKKLGDRYVIETAQGGYEALDTIRRRPFDLIITNLRMPGIDGLKLMDQARLMNPHTRLILMTGYGNADIEATAYRLGACRYIDKPFEIDDLIAEARKALIEPKAPGRDILVLSDDQFDAIAQCLSSLQFEVGSQCILLADVAGQLVAHIGETDGLDLPALISLIGGSFATSFEMARYLGESQALTLNYHEGERYDVYSSNVNEELFIVLLFDKHHRASRLGMVWLYARRTLKQLQGLVNSANKTTPGRTLDADFGALLSDSMDQLFGSGPSPAPQAVRVELEAPLANAGQQDTDTKTWKPHTLSQQAPPEPIQPDQLSTPEVDTLSRTEETFDLRQALELGLLDQAWLDDADGGY